jgi:putative ABC transport system permease protein
MGKHFFSKLAATNIAKNGKFYLPYLITCVGAVAMFYIMCFIASDPGLDQMQGAASLRSILNLGTVVVGIFTAIFLFYTNSFLMKRRQKELGLYNILGMDKRHIAKMLFFETLLIAAGSLVAGLLCGIFLSKLLLLLMYRLLRFPIPIGFSVSTDSLLTSAALFCGVFLLNLLTNLGRIRLAKPIELLKGGQTGEREPRTKKLLTAVGVLALGGGYAIALVTESPLQAIMLFFIAVLLVILGTYCLFTAGSIAFLKLLRNNQKYYYQTKHFVPVSGMIYRMKQNAVGLANICILSTMVLVMVSGTVSLYLGMENVLDNRSQTISPLPFRAPARARERKRCRRSKRLWLERAAPCPT